jgi:hypothetical protein
MSLLCAHCKYKLSLYIFSCLVLSVLYCCRFQSAILKTIVNMYNPNFLMGCCSFARYQHNVDNKTIFRLFVNNKKTITSPRCIIGRFRIVTLYVATTRCFGVRTRPSLRGKRAWMALEAFSSNKLIEL